MLTEKQEIINNRREVIKQGFELLTEQDAVSPFVAILAKRFKVSQVTIYGDMKALGIGRKIKKVN
jgi:DeoR/GlpR family transcriptional regulator of sugar metabolism